MPILFNVFNNHYGMGGQTRGETMGYDMAARLGAGFNPTMMHAERVNGYDPLAVIDAVTTQEGAAGSRRGTGSARRRHLPRDRTLTVRQLRTYRTRGGDRGLEG